MAGKIPSNASKLGSKLAATAKKVAGKTKGAKRKFNAKQFNNAITAGIGQKFASADLIRAAKGAGISDKTLRKMLKTEKKIQNAVQTGKTQRALAMSATMSNSASAYAQAHVEESKAQISANSAKEAQMRAYQNLLDGGTNQKENPVNPNDDSQSKGSYATDWIS